MISPSLSSFLPSLKGPAIYSSRYLNPCVLTVNSCIRWASKKASSSKRNTGGKSPGKRLGPKKQDGHWAYENQVLVKQKMYFRIYPGQFVRTGRDKTLVAQVAGTVRFTKERWHPKKTTPFGQSIAPTLSDKEMERTFVNIVPEEEIGRFKLVEQI
ncbi:large ribosomal subunit protein bL27m-like [Diadema antillarum]|uniref:large ribosomal subunit protein bL27m-like n=1 Tax=Diadema antillarum TaxID=105358 RepID=UPI003A871538